MGIFRLEKKYQPRGFFHRENDPPRDFFHQEKCVPRDIFSSRKVRGILKGLIGRVSDDLGRCKIFWKQGQEMGIFPPRKVSAPRFFSSRKVCAP
jgi:hypothetical protein